MLKVSLAGISLLPLLVSACGDDAAPPSGPRAEQERPSARASATAVGRFSFQVRDGFADALFVQIDASGCVERDVSVFGSQETRKEGPGKPTTTSPLAIVSVFELDFCTEQVLRDLSGVTSDAVFQTDHKLTEANLQATITAFDNLSGAEVPVGVDVTWTATGELRFETDRSRSKTPGILVSQWLKGAFREAAASGTVVVGGEDLATDATSFAQISRVRSGRLEIVRTRQEPPDTLP